MSGSHFDTLGAQFAWDATSLKAASTCQRYYYYMMIENLAERIKSVHLIFGGHYAKALETYHKKMALGLTHDEATLFVIRETMINTWEHSRTKTGERIVNTGRQQEFNSATKTRESLIRTIIWYLEEFKNSDYQTLIFANGKAAVEQSFKIEFANHLLYCGHLDRVLTSCGDNWIQDQKTTGSALGQYYFAQFDTDIQMSGYTFAGKAIFSIPVKGVMIDAVQVSDTYSLFMRGMTYRSEPIITEWHTEMLNLIEQTRQNTQAYRATLDVTKFPRNLTACGNFGGCSFRDICSTTPSLRKRFADSNYNKRETWNPLVER
jgi:hypothetical protein